MADGTLVVRDNNRNVISKLSFENGESLLLLCQKAGISLDISCNGRGTCGKCKVQFVKGAPLPQPGERNRLLPEELRAGFRLACMSKLSGDCEILLPKEMKPDVVAEGLHVGWKLARATTGVIPYFAVADIGTTTIVIEKRRKCDGSVVDTYKAINAQRAYGADVLSRMETAMNGRAEDLAEAVIRQLTEGIEQLRGTEETATRQKEAKGNIIGDMANAGKIDFMVIAANTTMIHLLMKYPIERLAKAPFHPVALDEIITEIAGVKTYIMPGISAFVGADIVAGLQAIAFAEGKSQGAKQEGNQEANREGCQDANQEKNHEKACESGKKLFIDLGTNAELALYDDKGGICTATAAGPAFEGDAGTGFFGSDMVAILAKLYESGIIDENGTLDDTHFESGVLVPCKGGELHISQKQIRNLQLAKAAVRAGIEVLMKKADITEEQIECVYLAGGFGYYLDVHAAVTIGLLPVTLEEKTKAVGNTALSGGAVYANAIMTKAERGLTIPFHPINLAEESIFEKNYISHMRIGQ